MRKSALPAVVLSLFLAGHLAARDKPDLGKISPEEAGWSSQALNEAAKLAGELGYSAITILYDGKEMFSWGKVETNYECHSIRKAFLSALYGICVEKGTIDLDATIKELSIDDTPKRTAPDSATAGEYCSRTACWPGWSGAPGTSSPA